MNQDSLARLVQRCVDRDLTSDEQQRFLRSLPADSSAWRWLALSLLADRTIEAACTDWLNERASLSDSFPEVRQSSQPPVEEFRIVQGEHLMQVVAPSPHTDRPLNGTTGPGTDRGFVPREAPYPSRILPPVPGRFTHWRRHFLVPALTAIAGVWIGLWLAPPEGPEVTHHGDHAAAISSVDTESPSLNSQPRRMEPEPMLVGQSAETQEATPSTPVWPAVTHHEHRESDWSTVPVLTARDHDHSTYETSVIPREVQDAFLRRGMRIEEYPVWISLPIDDGSSLAVPVQTLQVRHIGL